MTLPLPSVSARKIVLLPMLLVAVLLLGAGPVGRRSARAQSDAAGVSEQVETAEAPSDITIWVRAALRGLTAAGVIVLLIGATVLFFENRFVFRPTTGPDGDRPLPDPAVEEVTLRTRDGLALDGWWHPGNADGDSLQPVVLICHGRSGNIADSADLMCALADAGLAVLLFDYRGYGRSEGSPSELGLYLDAEAAYAHLVKLRKIPAERIVCLGRSLGAAVAIHLSLHRQTGGMILESPFQSVAALASKMLLVRPFVFLIKNQFDSLGGVRRLTVPLLVAHGDRDEMIPFSHGQRVFAAAPEPKQFVRLSGAGHDEMLSVGGSEYIAALREFCRRSTGGRGGE